jgi:hypothetical protein
MDPVFHPKEETMFSVGRGQDQVSDNTLLGEFLHLTMSDQYGPSFMTHMKVYYTNPNDDDPQIIPP